MLTDEVKGINGLLQAADRALLEAKRSGRNKGMREGDGDYGPSLGARKKGQAIT